MSKLNDSMLRTGTRRGLRRTLDLSLWTGITPLARNEWICWVTLAKKEDTRKRRIEVGIDKLRGGMRRPCCWPGCPHR